jgi:hypothetical protein
VRAGSVGQARSKNVSPFDAIRAGIGPSRMGAPLAYFFCWVEPDCAFWPPRMQLSIIRACC